MPPTSGATKTQGRTEVSSKPAATLEPEMAKQLDELVQAHARGFEELQIAACLQARVTLSLSRLRYRTQRRPGALRAHSDALREDGDAEDSDADDDQLAASAPRSRDSRLSRHVRQLSVLSTCD